MTVRFDLSEVNNLATDLATAPAKVRGEISKALTRSVNTMFGDVQASVPVDTGELRSSLEKSPASGLSRAVWSNTRAAFFQEHGTSRHAPQPSFFPALEREAPNFESAVADAAARLL